jgi:hypothetical protein
MGKNSLNVSNFKVWTKFWIQGRCWVGSRQCDIISRQKVQAARFAFQVQYGMTASFGSVSFIQLPDFLET